MRQPSVLFPVLCAGTAGVLIAIQPVMSVALLAVIALFLFSAITPLSTLLVLLILAPMRTLIETESPIRLPLDIGQLLVMLLILSWFVVRTGRRQRVLRVLETPLFVPLGLFFAIVSLTSLSAFSMGAWLSEWLKWGIMFALVIVALNIERHWQWLVFGLALAGVANALIGMYIFFGGSGATHLLINDRFFRAFGTFGQPNPFGGFMGLLSPLAAATALGYGLRWWQTGRSSLTILFYLGATALTSLGVILSWSRGAWLGWVIALGVVVVALPRRLWHSVLLIALTLLVSALLWTSGRLPASIVERIESATAEIFSFDDVRGVDISPANYAVVERLAHWQAALNMARTYPYLGVGMGNYEVAYPQFRLMNWDEPLGHAHNFYLNVLAEAGIIGLVGYLAFWMSVFWVTWRARNHPDPLARMVAVGLLGTWTYLSIHSLTDNLYVNNMFLHIGVMLGISAVLYRQAFTPLPIEVE